MRYHQPQGYFRLYTTQLRERLKIIRIAKHPAYSDSRFSRQLAYLKILILRKAKSRKAETNKAYVEAAATAGGGLVMGLAVFFLVFFSLTEAGRKTTSVKVTINRDFRSAAVAKTDSVNIFYLPR